jgi:hypothetical protein
MQQGRGSDALVAFLVHGFQEKSVMPLAQELREFPGSTHNLQSDFTEIAE